MSCHVKKPILEILGNFLPNQPVAANQGLLDRLKLAIRANFCDS
jgi:hypothetical protein